MMNSPVYLYFLKGNYLIQCSQYRLRIILHRHTLGLSPWVKPVLWRFCLYYWSVHSPCAGEPVEAATGTSGTLIDSPLRRI